MTFIVPQMSLLVLAKEWKCRKDLKCYLIRCLLFTSIRCCCCCCCCYCSISFWINWQLKQKVINTLATDATDDAPSGIAKNMKANVSSQWTPTNQAANNNNNSSNNNRTITIKKTRDGTTVGCWLVVRCGSINGLATSTWTWTWTTASAILLDCFKRQKILDTNE